LAWAIHFGWNFSLARIFGGEVSGFAAKHSLLVAKMSGPIWLTGGKYGVEQSVIVIPACLVIAALLLRGAWRRRQFVQFLPSRRHSMP
jgi:hypothetical protein